MSTEPPGWMPAKLQAMGTELNKVIECLIEHDLFTLEFVYPQRGPHMTLTWKV